MSVKEDFDVLLDRTEKINIAKGQLISKGNCQAVNSSKKRTNELFFNTMQRVFVHFLEEIANTKNFSKLPDL